MALACLALLPVRAANARASDPLVEMINAYRAGAAVCAGRHSRALAPLQNVPGLAKVQIGTGTFLELALERAGYKVEQADTIQVAGATDPAAVMEAIGQRYCQALLNTKYTQVGVRRSGEHWLIVLTEPYLPAPAQPLPDLAQADRLVLAAVNAARALPRRCGERDFTAAPPVSWNDALAATALGHSQDMARHSYFAHQGQDGRAVAERARDAGYRWRRVAENIAAGQESPEEVVAGWLSSPGHCVNIMNPEFSEMGAAHAVNTSKRIARVYWTQVFGAPR